MATKFRQIRKLDDMLKSEALAAVLDKIGAEVLASAQTDPNTYYVSTLDQHRFYTDRVRVQVGAAPGIGLAVEAKRGTLARALAAAGA